MRPLRRRTGRDIARRPVRGRYVHERILVASAVGRPNHRTAAAGASRYRGGVHGRSRLSVRRRSGSRSLEIFRIDSLGESRPRRRSPGGELRSPPQRSAAPRTSSAGTPARAGSTRSSRGGPERRSRRRASSLALRYAAVRGRRRRRDCRRVARERNGEPRVLRFIPATARTHDRDGCPRRRRTPQRPRLAASCTSIGGRGARSADADRAIVAIDRRPGASRPRAAATARAPTCRAVGGSDSRLRRARRAARSRRSRS